MRERLIKLIQEAVPGCATQWVELLADHLIENGLVAPQWIGVKDRLPEDGEHVIACDKERPEPPKKEAAPDFPKEMNPSRWLDCQ